MRVLLVSDSYPPLIGGATRAVHLLASGLARRGDLVTVATPWQAAAAPYELIDGVQVHRLDGTWSRLWRVARKEAIRLRYTPPPVPDPEVVWRLRRLIRKERPDAVLSYGWITYGTALALLGTGIPLVLSGRDYSNVCTLRTLLRRGEPCDGPALLKCLRCARGEYGPVGSLVGVTAVLGQRPLLRRRVRAIQSCSGYMQNILRVHLFKASDLERLGADVVIPDYRVESLTPRVAPLDKLPASPYILFVGALRTIKGIEVLFRAYDQLEDRPPLVLIGTRSLDPLPPLPPGAELFEAVPHEQVMAAWEGALFGVAPSILPEPFGNVIHEAMSVGRTVIGTVPGGHGEMIINGQTGLLVPSGDVDALADAMRLLLEQPELRKRLESGARDISTRFTEAQQLPKFIELLEGIALGGGHGS